MRKEMLFLLGWALAWLGGAFWLLAKQPPDPLLDQDEIYWIGSAYYYDLAFVRRDWKHEAWRLLPARENPPVAKYVFGFGLGVAGHRITSIDNLSYFYLRWLRWEKTPDARPGNAGEEKRAQVVWAATPEYQQELRRRPRAPLPRPVVDAARTTVLACAALGSLLLFLMGVLAGDRIAGLLASLFILAHPVAAAAASHAMSDTVALLFSIAAAGAVLLWHDRMSRNAESPNRQGWIESLTTGVVLALACGAKMNSLVLVLLAGLMGVVAMAQNGRRGLRRDAVYVAMHGLVVFAVALVVFVLINPAIINDFPGALLAVVTEHRYTESVQVDLHYPHPEGLWGKIDAVVAMAFYGWQFFLVVLTAAVGLAWTRWQETLVRVAVCWWFLALIGVMQWLPFAWPRYTIPILAPTALIVGLVISAAWRWLRTRVGAREVPLPAHSVN